MEHPVGRAADGGRATAEDVGVDLGGADIVVTEKFLHALGVEEGVPTDPRDVGLLGAAAVVPGPDSVTNAVEESWLR